MLIYLTTTVQVSAQNLFTTPTLADNTLLGQMTVAGAGALDQNGIRMFSDVTSINAGTTVSANTGLLAVVESYNTVNSQLGGTNPGYTSTSRSTPRMSLILTIANTQNGAAAVLTKDLLADCNAAAGFNLPNFYIGPANGLQATRAQVEDVAVSTVNLVSHTASVIVAISYQSYLKTAYVSAPGSPAITIWGNGLSGFPASSPAPIQDQIRLIKYNVTLNTANTAIVSAVATPANVSPVNLVNQFKYIKIDMNKGNTVGELLVGGNGPNAVVGGSQVTPINLRIFAINNLVGGLLKTTNAYTGSYINDVSFTENGNNDIAYACYSGKNVLNPGTGLYENRFALLKADMSSAGVITNLIFNQFGGQNNYFYPGALSAEEITTNGANPLHSLVIISSNSPTSPNGEKEIFYVNRKATGYTTKWLDAAPCAGAKIGFSQTNCAIAWFGNEGYPVWDNANSTKTGDFNIYGFPKPDNNNFVSGTNAWFKINTTATTGGSYIIPSIASHTGTSTANIYCPIWENAQGVIFYKQRPVSSLAFKKPNPSTENTDINKAFAVYPNPAVQDFSIDLPNASGMIYLINSTGNIVKIVEATSTTIAINEPLDKGVYTIKWHDAINSQDHFQKLSIQ